MRRSPPSSGALEPQLKLLKTNALIGTPAANVRLLPDAVIIGAVELGGKVRSAGGAGVAADEHSWRRGQVGTQSRGRATVRLHGFLGSIPQAAGTIAQIAGSIAQTAGTISVVSLVHSYVYSPMPSRARGRARITLVAIALVAGATGARNIYWCSRWSAVAHGRVAVWRRLGRFVQSSPLAAS